MSDVSDFDDLETIGEVAALARIIPRLGPQRGVLLGPGDDAAVLAAPDGRVVLTTDVMVEGPDFRRAWSRPAELGWKAAATNLADIAAMGARATGLLVAITAPGSTPIRMLEGIADGLASVCAALAPGCGVVGGDLTRSPTFTIAVTAIGSLDGRAPVTRAGARAGDMLAYAGRLGLAGAALRLLFAVGEQDVEAIAELRRGRPGLLAEQLAPSPPIDAGPRASDAGATAMLDVSDGLLLDANRIARASGVVLDLDPDALQAFVAAVATAAGLDEQKALAAVLGGGEDHGLLACFPAGAALPADFVRLGGVRAGDAAVLLGGAPIAPAGWDSFAP